MVEEPTFEELFRQAKHSAVHLEMRDGYMRSDPSFISWQHDPGSLLSEWDPESRPWLALMQEITDRGVEVRRARVFSEPMSDYLRFEHCLTPANIAAGEQVRWLPRRRASDLALPGNDFWLFDDSLVVFLHFTGEGELSPEGDEERTAEPSVVRLCSAAFESVWRRAVPHEEYRPV
ncbi:hypothetical protein HEK616_01510 [Streptomyces nigrescens]|uniref:DUF6879 domain-containing protein n=2 Tax=Streptomyces TaxID=1883 RepID=A0ABN6QQG1_STRNI|nr:DUF6879 family protein [Streptomyces nigrescens]MEE4423104.1 hypothetical protein [Streptomyces sp. DSM 41528]BDM66664.1 hypothetical protein HEK616_01510 [Streptomyces nigrescens]